MKPPQTIEEYLDRLADELSLEPRMLLRVLRESEDHLRLSTQGLIDEGLSASEAEIQAIDRFGSARAVAGSFNQISSRQFGRLAPALFVSLWELAVIGLLAVGLSGVFSFGLAEAFGKDFVAGDREGVVYSIERCADFFDFHPEAVSCNEAAAAHHFDEVLDSRLGAGLLGLVGMLAFFGLRRVFPHRQLPRGPFLTACAAVFGVAAVGFLLLGTGQLLTGTAGSGADLTAGIASLLVLVYAGPGSLLYLVRLTRGAANA